MTDNLHARLFRQACHARRHMKRLKGDHFTAVRLRADQVVLASIDAFDGGTSLRSRAKTLAFKVSELLKSDYLSEENRDTLVRALAHIDKLPQSQPISSPYQEVPR